MSRIPPPGTTFEYQGCEIGLSPESIGQVLRRERLDAVVSSDDSELTMSGGVSDELRRLAGETYVAEAREHAPARVGSVIITGPGRLPVRLVMHAITVDWKNHILPNERTMHQLGREIFSRCESLGIRSIAIPAVASGAAGLPAEGSVHYLARALFEHLLNRSVLQKVLFALPDPDRFAVFKRGVGLAILGAEKHITAILSGDPETVGALEPGYAAAPRSREQTRSAMRPGKLLSRLVRPSRRTDSSKRRDIASEQQWGATRPVLDQRYVVLEELGRGGFSTVDLCWDLVLRRTVAIKRMRPDVSNLNALANEASIAIDLFHEGIVRLYHFEPNPKHDGPFLVMEYVPWATGEKWVSDAGVTGLPPRVVLEVGLRVCNALAYAHERKVLHLDIKPGNLFVDPDGDRAKLADFGLSKIAASNRQALQAFPAGTPAYMAPEQLVAGTHLTAATDVYQLTATIWDLLTGEPPSRTGSRPVPEGIPAAVLERLSPGLDPAPTNRPRTAAELGCLLTEALAAC